MKSSMRLSLPVAVPLLTGLLALAGCPKKAPDVPDPDADGVGDVEAPLQVVAIEPDAVAAQQTVPARVLGAGFAEGASVRVGEQTVGAVQRVDENTLTLTLPALPDGVYDVTVENPDARTSTLRAGLRVGSGVAAGEGCEEVVVYFGLDESGLNDVARAALDAAAPCYTAATARLRVEGHADERGTTDYNLALGLRRADSVRAYLVNLGVPPARLETVSLGEERPADPGHDEAAWAKNRRAEVHLQQ